MSQQIPDDLVTVEEAARAVGVSVHTVQSWRKLKHNPLPWYRVGPRMVKVSLAEVRAYIEPKRFEPPVEPAKSGAE